MQKIITKVVGGLGGILLTAASAGAGFAQEKVVVGGEWAILELEKKKSEWDAIWSALIGYAMREALGECGSPVLVLTINGVPAQDWLRLQGCSVDQVEKITGIAPLYTKKGARDECPVAYTGLVTEITASQRGEEKISETVRTISITGTCSIPMSCEEVKVAVVQTEAQCAGLSSLAERVAAGNFLEGITRNVRKSPAEQGEKGDGGGAKPVETKKKKSLYPGPGKPEPNKPAADNVFGEK